jgi:3D (Asp-Asp-Asp) domain-containing protein/peptidoglycan hydrolase CwlO-like protein
VLASRLVRTAARRRAGVLTVVGAAVLALLGAAGANAVQSSDTTREPTRLQDANAALESKSRSVVLELYALDSRRAQVEARVAQLRARSAEVQAEREAARRHLDLVQDALATAEARLGERLRQLYVEGEPDPLGVLLGSESLHEALATIDNLDRFAELDREILADVKRARVELRGAAERLADESARVEALLRDAEQARASLVAAQAERRAYLESIRRQQNLNAAQLAALENQSQAAEEKSAEIAPPPFSGPPSGGRTMVVEATGYSLPGTTATGIPVGWGVVAVDPRVIPLGTRMTIPGYGEGVAADTGSAVRGNIIDLWFPTRAQALQWGRRTVTITLH